MGLGSLRAMTMDSYLNGCNRSSWRSRGVLLGRLLLYKVRRAMMVEEPRLGGLNFGCVIPRLPVCEIMFMQAATLGSAPSSWLLRLHPPQLRSSTTTGPHYPHAFQPYGVRSHLHQTENGCNTPSIITQTRSRRTFGFRIEHFQRVQRKQNPTGKSRSNTFQIDSVEESPTAGIHKLLSKTRTELAEKQKEKKAVTKAIARAKKMVREEQSNFRHLEDQGKMIQAEIRNLKEAKESVQDFVARRE